MLTGKEGVQLVTGIRANMKNKPMPLYDRLMLRKRHIVCALFMRKRKTAACDYSQAAVTEAWTR